MENSNTRVQVLSSLEEKVKAAGIPEELSNKVLTRLKQLTALSASPSFLPEVDSMTRYINWIASLPWNKRTQDSLDLEHAKQILDKNHYGLTDLKTRILEYLSVMKLTLESKSQVARAPILLFVGLVGTGKTTMAMSVAEALGRKVARIPFGGMGDALELRGQSRMHPEAEPGKVMKELVAAESKNPVFILDEIDRVTDAGRASIMGVLVELLDPRQNHAFVDHYIDYPFDLSEALFIATANNTTGIATAVMDRLEPISMPSYTDQEKVVIAQKYLMPRALKEAGMPENAITFDENVWPTIVRPLGFDAGIRTLERTIQGIVRKVAMLLVEGKVQSVRITEENLKQFLPPQ